MSSIDVRNESLYVEALSDLSSHKRSVGVGFAGRFVQVFLGLKFFQESIPSIYSGRFIGGELLQSLLDDLYAKQSQAPNKCVLSIFESSYKARTGLIAPGNVSAQNTWRNNFNLQKGVGCYAPVSDLSSPTFLDEERTRCRHLVPHVTGSLAGARCSLGNGAAAYRNESHRKWLRIDPGGRGYAATDLRNISNFLPIVAPNGQRIPLEPLIRAIYFDASPGLVTGQRGRVSIGEFMADFNFSTAEIDAYFEVKRWLPAGEFRVARPPIDTGAPVFVHGLNAGGSGNSVREIPDLYLPVAGTTAFPPATNSGWTAEKFVQSALLGAGWDAHLVSRQNVGYDIFAQKGRKKIYVEVKSSLSTCSPTLTSREWFQANHYKHEYILAIIENYNELDCNTVFWVPNPSARCAAVEVHSVAYRIPRSAWGQAVVDLPQIE